VGVGGILDISADVPRTSIESTVGWTLAAAVHPVIAWRVLPARRRRLIPLGYFGAAYLTVLASLLFFGI
jgi:hypothetical protein